MYYSSIVLLAILILLIENHDLLMKGSKALKQAAWKEYRRFLTAVLIYYVTDALWGILEQAKITWALYADTELYFAAMAGGILFWTQFAVRYVNEQKKTGIMLMHFGRLFAGLYIAAVIGNLFMPILFSVDDRCVYTAYPIRHIFLAVQIILLLLTAVHAFATHSLANQTEKERYRTIAFFSLIMAVFLTIQIWQPYLPLYSVAYLLGTCLLRTFVVNGEKEEYRKELEKAIERETQQYEELKNARTLAYKDTLTGVKTKLSYLEYEAKKDLDIKENRCLEFAVAVFDVNGLKAINDTFGHERGDQFIISACMTICNHFKHSPVFRIGGDEFVALIENEDYQNREELIRSFNQMMEQPASAEQAIIAMGVTDFHAETDGAFHDVFLRADRMMYERKRELKSMGK